MLFKPYTYVIFIILLLLSGAALYISFIKKESRQELKVAAALGSVRMGEVWKSRYEPFMTIPYSKCWEMSADMAFRQNQKSTDILDVQPSNLCNEEIEAKWLIMYETGLQRNPHELPPQPQDYPFPKELNLDGRIFHFYGDDQGRWIVNFKCGSVYFDIEKYRFSYQPQEPIAKNQGHEVPKAFQKFVSSINCDSR